MTIFALLETFSSPFYAMFVIAWICWNHYVDGSRQKAVAAVWARVGVFPGWTTPVWSGIDDILQPDGVWTGVAVGFQVIILAIYSAAAIEFLRHDDWWKGLGGRIRRYLKSYFTVPSLSFGGSHG